MSSSSQFFTFPPTFGLYDEFNPDFNSLARRGSSELLPWIMNLTRLAEHGCRTSSNNVFKGSASDNAFNGSASYNFPSRSREMWPSQADASVVPEVTPTSGPAHLRRMRERIRLPHGEAWTDVNLAVSGRLSQLFNLNESPWARFT